MRATIAIGRGVGKAVCEDRAFFGGEVMGEGVREVAAESFVSFGIADGVGGNAGGDEASEYLCRRLAAADLSAMTGEQLAAFTAALNRDLLRHASGVPGKGEMASTLTCLVRAADGFYLLHAGNTRLCALQGSYLKQLTDDHTTYNWLMAQGQFEAAEKCRRSEIYCCMGGGDPRYQEGMTVRRVFEEGLSAALLLTSDGVHDSLDLDSMEDRLSAGATDRQIAEDILQAAVRAGSRDDRTVMILRR